MIAIFRGETCKYSFTMSMSFVKKQVCIAKLQHELRHLNLDRKDAKRFIKFAWTDPRLNDIDVESVVAHACNIERQYRNREQARTAKEAREASNPNAEPADNRTFKTLTEMRDSPMYHLVLDSLYHSLNNDEKVEEGPFRLSSSNSEMSKVMEAVKANSTEASELIEAMDVNELSSLLKTWFMQANITPITPRPEDEVNFKAMKELPEAKLEDAFVEYFYSLPVDNQKALTDLFMVFHLIAKNKKARMNFRNIARACPFLIRDEFEHTSNLDVEDMSKWKDQVAQWNAIKDLTEKFIRFFCDDLRHPNP